MTAFARKNFSGGATSTTLASSMSSTDTVFSIVSAAGWPGAPGVNFSVVIDRGNAAEEKILCSSNSGTAVNVASGGRGQDGTTATTHAQGASVEVCFIAQDADEANQVAHLLGNMAKGSLAVGQGSGALAIEETVGTNGYVLTADSTQTAGVKWAAASSYTLTAAEVEALFTADGQIFAGTGNGTGQLQQLFNPQSKSSAYTANPLDFVYATGTTTITVPVTAGAAVAVQNAGTGTITVQPASGVINAVGNWGASSITLTAQGQAVFLVGDGTNVNVVAQENSPPSSAMTLISSQVLASAAATVTFSSIPGTYNHLLLKCQMRSSYASETDIVLMRLNSDTGSNYDAEWFYASGSTATATGQAAATAFGPSYLPVVAASATAGDASFLDAEILQYAGTTFRKTVKLDAGYTDFPTNSADGARVTGAGTWRNTAAVTTITLTLSSGSNFVTGSGFYLYGVK